ncbi:uncharacterized, partial [Tachysurus ichikawai]
MLTKVMALELAPHK